MDEFFSWIKSIVIYLLLVSLIYQIFPDSQYKKYMRVCTGLILILVAVWPLVRFSETDRSLSYYLDLERTRIDARDFEQISAEALQTRSNQITGAYKLQLEQKVFALFAQTLLYPAAIEMTIIEDIASDDYGRVQKVVVTVTDRIENVENAVHTDMRNTSAAALATVEIPQVSIGDISGDPETSDAVTENPAADAFCDASGNSGADVEIAQKYREDIEKLRQLIAGTLHMDVEKVYIRWMMTDTSAGGA